MGCNVEIPEIGGCLKDFLEALPAGMLAGVAETMDGFLAEISDQTLGRVDGFIRGFERKAAELLAEQDRLRRELMRLEDIVRAAEAFLARIDCPELRVLREMWDDQKRKAQEALAKIDLAPVNDALRKYRELKSELACQQANARKVRDFIGSIGV